MLFFFLLNSESKITYWNIKIRADEHATNGEKGVFSQNQYFSPSHLHLMSIKTYHWPFSFLKNAICLCTYTSYFMYNKGMGKGEMKEQRNYTVVVSMWWNQIVVFNLRMSSWSGGTEIWSKVAGSLFRRHLLSAAGIHQLYLHLPSPTVQMCLSH